MLITVALMTENLGGWISLNVPIDHALDPGDVQEGHLKEIGSMILSWTR